MTNVLNAQEAFTALQKGKTVLCRYAGDGTLLADKDFSNLDQMPATVFALPNYEFCIQVEMLELAGITFTKPLTIEEIEQGQDVFLIQPHAVIQQYKFNENLDELVDGIHAGFAQRDFENAQLQYKAFCEAVGGTPIQVNLEIVEQPRKKRASKKQNDSNGVVQQSNHAANDEVSLDDIIGPVGDQKPTSNDVEKRTLDEIPAQSELQTNPISFDSVAAAVVNKAKEIDWIAEYIINEGYDIASYNNESDEFPNRFIEVKSYEGLFPYFYWSRNEYTVAKQKKHEYWIYLINRLEMNNSDYVPLMIQNPFETILTKGETWDKQVEKYRIELIT